MKRNELINLLVKSGYRVFEVSVMGEKMDYFYTVTPNGAILYVQPEKWGGYTLSYQYRPSRETGTGCRCNDEAQDITSIEQMQQLEREGAVFAHKLRAVLWPSWEAFSREYWATLTEYVTNEEGEE